MARLVRAVTARLETAAIKELNHGIYFSKEKPKAFTEDDYEDEEGGNIDNGVVARLSGYNTGGEAYTYLFKTSPKLLAKIGHVSDLIVALAKGVVPKGAKYISKSSDGETTFLFSVTGGFVVIAFDND